MFKQNLTAILLVATVAACNSSAENGVSGSACAERQADGTIVECEPDESSLAQLKSQMRRMAEIDREYPGPKFPGFDHLHSVEIIESDGEIHLENGEILTLAGLDCNQEALQELLTVLFVKEPKSNLAFTKPTGVVEDLSRAYIWEVDTGFSRRHGIEGGGPTRSNVSENSLRGGICEPEQQQGHRFHERYLRIDALYSREDL